MSLHKWWDRNSFESVHFPTGLWDQLYYAPNNADFETTSITLVVDGKSPVPLFRKNVEPVEKPDARMVKKAEVAGRKLWLYADERRSPTEQEKHFYVKTAPGKYIEFSPDGKSTAPPAGDSGSSSL